VTAYETQVDWIAGIWFNQEKDFYRRPGCRELPSKIV
jgi:hypothetical protein